MKDREILLLTHGGWGQNLLQSVEMIAGKLSNISEIALTPEMTMPEFLTLVEEKAETMGEGSLILTDLFGGTTTNIAAKVGREKNFKVISGLNAGMLLQAGMQISNGLPIDTDELLKDSKASIKDVIADIMASLAKKEG